MYLVLSAFTSSPISLVATTKASAFSFTVCTLPPSIVTSSAYAEPKTLVTLLASRSPHWPPSIFTFGFPAKILLLFICPIGNSNPRFIQMYEPK